ncbi:MAG: DNA polymerase III subunit beta [Alphaproteobacteria bacterium]|nr:MAG: DNA polymerase III subunit beta [Rickettsiaceae bacterium 4572_127]
MQFTITHKDLLKSLSHVVPIAERKSTIPILTNIKIEAGNNLVFTTTNTDIETIETVPAQIIEEGKTTVPAHILYDIARTLTEDEVSFATKDGKMVISAGKAKFSLPMLPADDFPMMSGTSLPFKFKISPDDLISLIDKTKFAVSNEETRYYLNGIYLHVVEKDGQNLLRSSATDGGRLAIYDVPAPEGSKGMPSVIVPKQVIAELRKFLDSSDKDITVEVSETKTRFLFENATMTSKLIDGKYPNYLAVIPKGNDKKLIVNTAKFKNCVARMSSVSIDKFQAVKMIIEKDSLTLTANSPEAGTGTEEMVASYDGETIEILFNYKKLLDMTNQVETEELEFSLANSTAPAIMKEKGNDHFLYVIMPLRL